MASLSHNVHMNRVEYLIGRNGRSLIGYIHEDYSTLCETYRKRPAILIFPGGGYGYISPREEDPVLFPFFTAGYQVFMLRYSVVDDILSSSPEGEAAEALALIRKEAESLNIESDKIAVMGFSAGGHLAASIAAHQKRYGVDSRVDAAILCYPVITMGRYAHQGSKEKIVHGDASLIDYYSIETQVNEDMPPCFIWHTAADETVPVENSLLMASSLREKGISFELHIFSEGCHGLSAGHNETGMEEKGVQVWIDLAIAWLSRLFSFTL